MNIEQSTDLSSDAGHSGPDYARRNPLEIGVQLRNLVNRGDFLTVQYPGGQLVTRLLEVDVGARAFVFDWGALAEQNSAILGASHCTFAAAPDGVRVEFVTSTPRETRYEGLPAFEANFPDLLYCIQRREYFRVDAPVIDPYLCRGKLPDGESFLFEVHNLSLGGVGLRTADERVEALEVGTVLPEVELQLNGHGKLLLDLKLVSQRSTEVPNGTRRFQLGFRFMSLPGSAENTLQRLITQLEMKRRQLARA
ncbi:flagellar brake protein [Burkholderia sp. Ac-20353]|uniref:flagellar brake protein n=1 Tax=Burkholderia sp. Ac-20353 TaxID=2703894 RepID=UPI00197C0439|nr:flagellar brake protein [Burkholderia sp. Ac-20353]MBN3791783.1 flagellar brake protein [Burkholderia sp. Ac-20353]